MMVESTKVFITKQNLPLGDFNKKIVLKNWLLQFEYFKTRKVARYQVLVGSQNCRRILGFLIFSLFIYSQIWLKLFFLPMICQPFFPSPKKKVIKRNKKIKKFKCEMIYEGFNGNNWEKKNSKNHQIFAFDVWLYSPKKPYKND